MADIHFEIPVNYTPAIDSIRGTKPSKHRLLD
jgi:hypothetical protein